MIDGQQQRRALTAAEQALQALGQGDADRALEAAARASELDQVEAFARLADAVATATGELERTGKVSAAAWLALSEAVGPGPLQAIIDEGSGETPNS